MGNWWRESARQTTRPSSSVARVAARMRMSPSFVSRPREVRAVFMIEPREKGMEERMSIIESGDGRSCEPRPELIPPGDATGRPTGRGRGAARRARPAGRTSWHDRRGSGPAPGGIGPRPIGVATIGSGATARRSGRRSRGRCGSGRVEDPVSVADRDRDAGIRHEVGRARGRRRRSRRTEGGLRLVVRDRADRRDARRGRGARAGRARAGTRRSLGGDRRGPVRQDAGRPRGGDGQPVDQADHRLTAGPGDPRVRATRLDSRRADLGAGQQGQECPGRASDRSRRQGRTHQGDATRRGGGLGPRSIERGRAATTW